MEMTSAPPALASGLEVPIFGPEHGILAVEAGARRLELNRIGSYSKISSYPVHAQPPIHAPSPPHYHRHRLHPLITSTFAPLTLVYTPGICLHPWHLFTPLSDVTVYTP